ncbi:LptF/LptG family permease, partial [Treponema sp.]
MKIITYMLKSFFPIFLGALLFFVLVLCLTDLFINLWNYISKGAAFKDVGLILLYYVPKTIWYSIPIAMLFATAYMLSDFYARNELLAIFA